MVELQYKVAMRKFSQLKNSIEIPRFQRGIVWSDKKKAEFIKTLKAGLPIGVLLLSQKETSTPQSEQFLVIDGLQRFSTMKQYADNPFIYVDESQITEEQIRQIIYADHQVTMNFSSYNDNEQKRVIDFIRSSLVQAIRSGKGKSLNSITTDARKKICSDALFYGCNTDDIQEPIFRCVDKFLADSSINDIEIPLIIFHGNGADLAEIFQKLNQEGVRLTKYDVFAATWVDKTVTIHDEAFIKYVIDKYEAAQNESQLEIANYNPDEMRSSGVLTVFEYAYALGKDLAKNCPVLFPNKRDDDTSVSSIGFLVLAEILGLSYAEMGEIANKLLTYQNLDYKTLKNDIVDSAKYVESALIEYISMPTKKKTSLACHSELQLASYIIVIFKLKYKLSHENGLEDISASNRHYIKDVKNYLFKHYLYDILRNFWAGSGDSKLEEIIADPISCRYTKDVDKTSFENVLTEWLTAANEKNTATVSIEIKLFLNYLLRKSPYPLNRCDFDVEHCVPKKVWQDYFKRRNIDVPISTPCNLIYIPAKDNRAKGDLTYYQRQAIDPVTYSLNEEALDQLLYPRRDELSFVESTSTLTKENYLHYLNERMKTLVKNFISRYYD